MPPGGANPPRLANRRIAAHLGAMPDHTPTPPASQPAIRRATVRPGSFTKPAHWTNEPAPTPATAPEGKGTEADPAGLSPTRYGDWVRDGIAVDF